jgi:hypothetical protein
MSPTRASHPTSPHARGIHTILSLLLSCTPAVSCAGSPTNESPAVDPPGAGSNAGSAGSDGTGAMPSESAPYDWQLPPGFPPPAAPEGDPMTVGKVELGRRLFYDKRLSDNGTYSCAACHEQALAFARDRLHRPLRARPEPPPSEARGADATFATFTCLGCTNWRWPLGDLERRSKERTCIICPSDPHRSS